MLLVMAAVLTMLGNAASRNAPAFIVMRSPVTMVASDPKNPVRVVPDAQTHENSDPNVEFEENSCKQLMATSMFWSNVSVMLRPSLSKIAEESEGGNL